MFGMAHFPPVAHRISVVLRQKYSSSSVPLDLLFFINDRSCGGRSHKCLIGVIIEYELTNMLLSTMEIHLGLGVRSYQRVDGRAVPKHLSVLCSCRAILSLQYRLYCDKIEDKTDNLLQFSIFLFLFAGERAA